MFNWLREFLEIRADFRERKRDVINCQSCETLKMQLAIANEEKKQLLNTILEKPQIEEPVKVTDLKPILPRTHLAWNERRRALEANDRNEAKIRQEKELEINKISTDDLEKELKIAESIRESEGVNHAVK